MVKRVALNPDEKDRDILLKVLGPETAGNEDRMRSLSRQCLLLWDSPELTQHMATGPAWERRCYNFVKIMPYIGTCTFNCAYCWFKDPVLIPRVNAAFFDRLSTMVDEFEARNDSARVFTFTHYKTDCFSLEHLTNFCRRAADFFEDRPGFSIQFLTKTSWVDSLLRPPVPTRALVGFSINPGELIDEVDLGTAPLQQRLEAAARLSAEGMAVVFRVDPMMMFPGWEEAYQQFAHQVLATVRPQQITFGTPRFQSLHDVATVADYTNSRRAKRFMLDQVSLMGVNKPGQSLNMDPNAYFKNMAVSYPDETRLAMYRNALAAFRSIDPDIPMGLCEEPAPMWDAVGLNWTGDRSRDCSCNFLTEPARAALPTAQRRQLTILQQEAVKADQACCGAANPTGTR